MTCPTCQDRATRTQADRLIVLLREVHAEVVKTLDTPATVAAADTMNWEVKGDAGASVPAALVEHPRYRLIRQLGSGGMGTVWLAEQKVMGRQVALKVIRAEHLEKPGAIERFHRETHAAARLQHPNIVAAHDAEHEGSAHFLVMEYVEGVSLAEHLARTGPLPIMEACHMARDAAVGLQHAHEHGLIHRDLKPHNLMRTADGSVKILDFGLAVFCDVTRGAGGLTGENVVLGTPDYIAPEQAEDSRTADIRSDIYSLGCTLYQLLTGQLPFPGLSVLKKLDAHRTRQPEPIRKLRPEVPVELASLIARMMAKKPADRFQTPAEVVNALEPFTRPAAVRQQRKRWPLVAVFAIVALIVASVLAFTVANGTHVYRVLTDKGEIVISAESDDVEVSIRKGGQEITVLDAKTKKSIVLDSGDYELQLKGAPSGLKLTLDKVTLKRGDVRLATIVRVPVTPAPVEQPTGLVRHHDFTIPWPTKDSLVPIHVFAVLFSPDGKYYAAVGDASEIRVWKVADGKLASNFDHHTPGWTGQAAWLPDSKHMVSMLHHANNKDLYVWDALTGKLVGKLQGHTKEVLGFGLSPDGKRVVSFARDQTVRIWDFSLRKELLKMKYENVPENNPFFLRAGMPFFSPDGNRIVMGDGLKVRFWDADNGKEVLKLEGHTAPPQVRLFSDGSKAVTWADDRTIRVWDAVTGKQLHCFREKELSDAELRIVPGNRQMISTVPGGGLQFWDLDTYTKGKLLTVPEQVGGPIFTDGRRLCAASDRGAPTVFDLETGKELIAYPIPGADRGFSFSPDGHLLATGSFRRGVYILRLPDKP